MKTLSERSPIRFIAKLLAAFLLCLTIAVSLSVNVAVRADGGEEPPIDPIPPTVTIGVVLPNTEYHYKVNQRIVTEANAQGYIVKTAFADDMYSQGNAVWGWILRSDLDYIIIAPGYSTPNTRPNLLNALDTASTRGTKIIVLGAVETGYPFETIFLLIDYFPLGQNHAETMLEDNPDIDENAVINVYYYQSTYGESYKEGVKNTLDNHGISQNVEYIPITDPFQVLSLSEIRIMQDPPVQEIMTHMSEAAELILQVYYNDDYYDTYAGDGTGIRMFTYNEDEIEDGVEYERETLTFTIFDIIESDITGKSLDIEIEMVLGEYYVAYYIDYVLGYSKYVTK